MTSSFSHSTLWISLVLLSALACDYEPEKKFFRTLPKPDATGITIDLTSRNDTVYLFSYTSMTFAAGTGKRKIDAVIVYFNGQPVASTSDSIIVFNLSSNSLSDGIYDLHIDMTVRSATNSLADQLGVEKIKLTRKWVVIVDRSPPQPVRITSIEPVDGTLRFIWQRYNQHNFQYYQLDHYAYNRFFKEYALCSSQIITDPNTLTLDDFSYMGGPARYVISVKAADTFSDTTRRDYNFTYNPTLQLTWPNQTTARLTWKKAPFYRNFSAYNLLILSSQSVQTIYQGISDTSVVLKPDGLLFGLGQDALLTVYPNVSCVYNLASDTATLAIGKRIPQFYYDAFSYNAILNKYFAVQPDGSSYSFISIDGNTLKKENHIGVSGTAYAVSENGLYAYVTQGTTVLQIEPSTFEVLASYDLSSYTNLYIYSLSVSNGNLLCVNGYNGNLFQMPGLTLIKTDNTGNMKISSSGQILFSGTTVYRWDGSSFNSYATVPLSGVGYFNGDSKLVVAWSTVAVIDLNSGLVINTIAPDNSIPSFSYDPVSDLIGRITYDGTNERCILYSTTSPDPIKTFVVANTISYNQSDILVNNSIVCSSGFIAPLSSFP